MENLIKRPYAINGLDRISNKTTSPFASRPNEYIVHCDYPEKAKYISQYNITETQKLVLESIAEMLFCTSKLIMAKLDGKGFEPQTIRNAIDSLFAGGYLHKVKFCGEDNKSESSFRVYFLTYKKGGCLYKSVFGSYPKRITYAESISDPSTVWKHLIFFCIDRRSGIRISQHSLYFYLAIH